MTNSSQRNHKTGCRVGGPATTGMMFAEKMKEGSKGLSKMKTN